MDAATLDVPAGRLAAVWAAASRHADSIALDPASLLDPDAATVALTVVGCPDWLLARLAESGVGVRAPSTAPPTPAPDLRLTPAPLTAADRPGAPRVRVALSLAPGGRGESAEVWVVPGPCSGTLRRLAEAADERTLGRLSVARLASADGEEVLLVRARPGREAAPVLLELGTAYRPLAKIPNLFAPAGRVARPAVRRDALRAALAGGVPAGGITWLEPAGGSFRVRHARSVQWVPWGEAVRYAAPAAVARRAARPGSDFLEPLAFAERPEPAPAVWEDVRREARAAPLPRPVPVPAAPREPWWRRLLRRVRPPAPPPPPAAPPPLELGEAVATFLSPVANRAARGPAVPVPDAGLDRRRELERRVLETLGEMDAPGRAALWPELASLYQRSNLSQDAAVCWLNALWEDAGQGQLWAWGWLKAESRQVRGPLERDPRGSGRETPSAVPVARWLDAPPSPARVRSLAAWAVWAARAPSPGVEALAVLPRVQALLERHEGWLPVRAAWLARLALSRLSGDDVLALARTRDRLAARMGRGGLSLDLDVPSFLRFASQGMSDRYQTVRDWLARARDGVRRWVGETTSPRMAARGGGELPASASRLQYYGIDAETHLTRAYADFVVAWGLARLGEHSASNALRQQARQTLPREDAVHATLADAFDFRIRAAQEGKPHAGPLPEELLVRISALSDEDRYKVDKLRETLGVLEPSERVVAYFGPVYRHQQTDDALLNRLRRLPDLADARELSAAARQALADGLASARPFDLPLVLGHLFDVTPRLGEGLGAQLLGHAGAALDRLGDTPPAMLRLLEKACHAAVELRQAGALRDLSGRLTAWLRANRGPASRQASELPLVSTLRGLRKLGLPDECRRLLAAAEASVGGAAGAQAARQRDPRASAATLRTLLHVAGGWLYVGREADALAVLDEARELLLYAGDLPQVEQTALALAYASALGHAPVPVALGRLEELFQRLRGVTVTSSTNSHYTLKPLEVVDRVVRAVVNDDFSLGPAVRRWLDDDEYLTRGRIDRDVHAALARAER